jgi:hypothetical protein
MANALYPKWKEAIQQASANSSLAGTVKVALVDTGTYTYNAAHEFLTSLTGVVGTAQTIVSKTFTNGVLGGADVTFSAVSGPTVEALVIYTDSGSAATSRLVAYIDTDITGIPVTPNGGDIAVTWSASGIFQL